MNFSIKIPYESSKYGDVSDEIVVEQSDNFCFLSLQNSFNKEFVTTTSFLTKIQVQELIKILQNVEKELS